MFHISRALAFALSLVFLFAACTSQTADGGPQTASQTADSGLQTASPAPSPTETPLPQPSLESLGLTAEIQQMFDRQGWQIKWDSQNARYTINQRKWDENTQTFLNETTHEIGWIDTEGNFHTRLTRFSATENPDGTWKDTSTTQDIVIDLKNLPQNPDLIIKQQLDENGNPISFQEKLKTPGFHLLETKNPAFEKTGILTLTYLDENGIPKTLIYNRELNFLQMPEISTDLRHPTHIPIEAVHSLAAHQLLILNYGDGEPFPTENFPGWSLQFYYESNGTKQAILWPRSGETTRYIRFIGENDFNIPWFMILLPDGTAFPSAPVEIFNPQDPQNPTDGSQKLILFPALFTGTMTPHQRFLFQASYPTNKAFLELAGYQKLIILAQKGGYFTALYKINDGGWNKVGNRSPLDSLLGMEGNKTSEIPSEGYKKWGNYHYSDIFLEGFPGAEKSPQGVYEIPIDDVDENGNKFYIPLEPQFQNYVLVISP